jgi:polyhydroxyalkanoate synthase subunit PhaE
MAKTKQNPAEMINQVVDQHGKLVETMTNTAKQLTQKFPIVNETLDKGHEFYKTQTANGVKMINNATEKIQNNINNMTTQNTNNFFNQWMDSQMNMAKSMFNNQATTSMNDWNSKMTEAFSNYMGNSSMNGFMDMFKNPNPMMGMSGMNPAAMQQMMQPMMEMFQKSMNNDFMKNMVNNPMSSMTDMNAISDMMRNMMSMNLPHKMTETFTNWQAQTKNYTDMMNNSFGDWTKMFGNNTTAESFMGMQNMMSSLSKFAEMFQPVFESMKDGKFNTSNFNEMMNPTKYKEFMDGFFGFMPDANKQAMEQMQTVFVNNMKQMATMGSSNYNFMKHASNNNPMNTANPFGNVWEMYSMLRNAMSEATSPLSKLMEGNSSVEAIKTWNGIYDKMVAYNVKNNELQYMMYQHGTKVLQDIAESVMTKMEKGESVDSIVKIYQEWMTKGDQVFTSLFETDAYSALMTEVSSLQMKLKMELEQQMEKMLFTNMPIATRTEMDEVYKSLYDLKKMTRNLEKVFGVNSSEVVPVKSATTKSSKPVAKKSTVIKPVAKKVVATKTATKTVKKVVKKK